MSSGTGLQIERVSWHPQHAEQLAEELGRTAERHAGERLLADAAGRIPYATGELESSGVVVDTDEGVAIAYTAEHARYVHGRGRALGGRDAHWLESSIDADRAALGDDMAQTFRSGWPGR
ncbi:MAG TPA: hypothetical protein VFI34_07650 [Candidatus Limnocylindrales bacterium]|nr:hypothetical protein [Candidatus Limnocylindrales bacterium]